MNILKKTFFLFSLSAFICFRGQACLEVEEIQSHDFKMPSLSMNKPDKVESFQELWLDDLNSNTEDIYKAIQSQPHTTHLSLSERSLRDDTLKMLGSFPNIQHLYLAENCFTDEGVKNLTNFTQLKEIDLSRNYVSFSGLKSLPLDKLEILSFNFPQEVTKKKRRFLENLVSAPKLEEVYLAGCSLEEQDVDILTRSTTLKRLDISYNNFGKEIEQKLKERFPRLYVINNN